MIGLFFLLLTPVILFILVIHLLKPRKMEPFPPKEVVREIFEELKGMPFEDLMKEINEKKSTQTPKRRRTRKTSQTGKRLKG